MLAEELHRKYRADLAKAKDKDRREGALVFLDIIVEVGRFEVCALTIRRYLLLDYLKSPFLGGSGDRMPAKEDVIAFLWIMNPKFKLGKKAARRFYLKNWLSFLSWRSLAMEIAGLIVKAMDIGTLPSSSKDAPEPAADWVATIVDGAASQYSWSEKEIFDLPLARAMAYMGALGTRLSGEKSPSFSKHSDKVRNWYLAQINKAETQKQD